jgi:long-chain acyl-CoA synthetase
VVTGRVPRGPHPVKPGSTSLLTVPLFHIGGLQQIINAMVTGARLVFSQGRFDVKAVIDLIEREDVRVWSTVPTMAQRVADDLRATGRSLAGLRTLGLGGSPVSEDMRADLRAAFPSARERFGITWGLTEAGGVVTTGAGPELERRRACVGRLLPTSEVRVDAPDEMGIGELLVRSPSVMLGYWGRHGLERGPLQDDRWLRSGDLGSVDEDGWVYVLGREKDVLIRGGENVSSLTVEDALCRHASVLEAAVVGVPDRLLGETVGAVVVTRPGAPLSESEIADFVRPHLAHFEMPSCWWIRSEPLPRNAAGKVVKPALASELRERVRVRADGSEG